MATQHFFMATPGERLDVGPHGALYESMMGLGQAEEEVIVAKSNAEAAKAAAEPDIPKAALREIKRMKSALKGWM